MKVIITAGGTGGHIYPALAIIHKIKEKEPNSKFLYIGTTDRMEAKIIPEQKIPYCGIEMKGIDRKHIFKNFKVLKMYMNAIKTAQKEIAKFQPDIVIGVGGYISAPVVYAAKKMGYKTMIHEQNSISGVSNKFLSHYVDKILVSFKETMNDYPKHKVVYTGNPRSEEIIEIPPIRKEELGLSRNKKLIIIVMGSLGSTTMTEKLKEIVPSFKNKSYEVLLITGKDYYAAYQDVKVPKNVKLMPFCQDLIRIMKQADIMVTRSGASTIAEITAIGLPSIMVPSPYVTHNHQMKNALALEKEGACKIIPEDRFEKDTLIPAIDELLNDDKQLQTMKIALEQRSVKNSATRIYEEAKKLVEEK